MAREAALQIRVSTMEKIEIEQNAANVGKAVGPFLRDLGLGRETSTTPRAKAKLTKSPPPRPKPGPGQIDTSSAVKDAVEREIEAGPSIPDMSDMARAAIAKSSAAFESRVDQLVASGTARGRAERQARREGL